MRNVKTREGYEIWDRICALPRYGFVHSPDNSRVLKVEGIGSWIDMYEAQRIVDDAQGEVNVLRAALIKIIALSDDIEVCERATDALIDSRK